MTLSSANESGSALNPFSKSIKRANKSRAVTGLPVITAGIRRPPLQDNRPKLVDIMWDKRERSPREESVFVYVCVWGWWVGGGDVL